MALKVYLFKYKIFIKRNSGRFSNLKYTLGFICRKMFTAYGAFLYLILNSITLTNQCRLDLASNIKGLFLSALLFYITSSIQNSSIKCLNEKL